MKIQLAQIPAEGLDLSLRIDLGTLDRLRAEHGEQRGELKAQLRVKNREGNVQIDGDLEATLEPSCQRCLEPVSLTVAEPIHVAMVPARTYADAPDDLQLGQGDLELSFYEGEELDLAQVLEEELLLLIPEAVAEEDEQGRCLECGKDVDALFAAGPEENENHPFAALKGLIKPE